MKLRFVLAAAAAAALAGTASVAAAGDAAWSFRVDSVKDGAKTRIEYTPLAKASKKWKLCALFPHLKDSYWLSVDYGMVEEARRQGVALTILQAGGYDQLPKQLSQYDDCLNSGADAVLVSPISEAGVANKIEEGMKKGIPQVAVANPVLETPITAKISTDYHEKGLSAGKYVIEYLGDKGGEAVAFPGPQGSGWAETYMSGFRDAVKDSKIKLLDEKYGDTGVAEQLRLVQDALQTYPEMTVIWGTAPTVEAAIGALAAAGRSDVTIMASYENQAMLQNMLDKKILGFSAEYPVMMGRIGVDLAVRALEKQPLEAVLSVPPDLITNETLKKVDIKQILAPQDYKPEFNVE
jgi:protein TorT